LVVNRLAGDNHGLDVARAVTFLHHDRAPSGSRLIFGKVCIFFVAPIPAKKNAGCACNPGFPFLAQINDLEAIAFD
jgi:hypothetical protein